MNAPLPRVSAGTLAAVFTAIAIAGLGFGTSMPLLAILLEKAGYSSTLIGLSTAVNSLAALIVLPFVPAALRRHGPARLLMICLAAIALSLIAMRAIVDIWIWIPLRFIFGAALATMFTASEFWINALANERNRGRLVGLYAATFSIGWAIGPLLLAGLGIERWTPVIAATALLGFALFPLMLASRTAPVPEHAPGLTLRTMLRAAPLPMLAAFVFGAVEIGVFALLPVYALGLGLSAETGAKMLAALSAGNIALQYPIGWLADRMDRTRLLLICALAGVAGAIATPLVVSMPLLLYATLFLWGGFVVGLYTMGLTLLGEQFKGPSLAPANAAVMLFYSAGGLVAPPISGAVMDLLPPHGLVLVLGLLCGSYGLFTLFWLGKIARAGARA